MDNNNYKNMKKYLLILTLVLTFFFQTAYALENTYPEIIGYNIDDGSGLADYVAYAFAFAISIGSVIVLIMIISAGIDFIIAGGEPGKISSAKSKIQNALFGIVILLSSYWVLQTINPSIKEIKDPNLKNCLSGGLILKIQDGEKITERCISQSERKLEINGTIISQEWTYEDGAVKEIWAFTGEDFQGAATKIFQDLNPRTPQPFNVLADISSDIKSLYILPRFSGLYLYDAENYGIETNAPIYINTSIKDLNVSNKFSDKASSFMLVDGDSRYAGFIFDSINYVGACSPFSINMSPTLNHNSSFNIDYIGNKKTTSIILYKRETAPAGKIVLYNNQGCPEQGSAENTKCEIDVTSAQGKILILGAGSSSNILTEYPCPDFIGDITSIKISGSGGIVVRGTDNSCHYYDSNDILKGGDCIGSIKGDNVFIDSLYSSVRPKEVMVFPLEK